MTLNRETRRNERRSLYELSLHGSRLSFISLRMWLFDLHRWLDKLDGQEEPF